MPLCGRKARLTWGVIFTVLGITGIVVGALIQGIVNSIMKDKLSEKLSVLSNQRCERFAGPGYCGDGDKQDAWRGKVRGRTRRDYYIFNITNLDAVVAGEESKLRVQEVGPLQFYRDTGKYDVAWPESSLFSYREWQIFSQRENTPGTDMLLDREVTIVNPVYMGGMGTVRQKFPGQPAEYMLSATGAQGTLAKLEHQFRNTTGAALIDGFRLLGFKLYLGGIKAAGTPALAAVGKPTDDVGFFQQWWLTVKPEHTFQAKLPDQPLLAGFEVGPYIVGAMMMLPEAVRKSNTALAPLGQAIMQLTTSTDRDDFTLFAGAMKYLGGGGRDFEHPTLVALVTKIKDIAAVVVGSQGNGEKIDGSILIDPVIQATLGGWLHWYQIITNNDDVFPVVMGSAVAKLARVSDAGIKGQLTSWYGMMMFQQATGKLAQVLLGQRQPIPMSMIPGMDGVFPAPVEWFAYAKSKGITLGDAEAMQRVATIFKLASLPVERNPIFPIFLLDLATKASNARQWQGQFCAMLDAAVAAQKAPSLAPYVGAIKEAMVAMGMSASDCSKKDDVIGYFRDFLGQEFFMTKGVFQRQRGPFVKLKLREVLGGWDNSPLPFSPGLMGRIIVDPERWVGDHVRMVDPDENPLLQDCIDTCQGNSTCVADCKSAVGPQETGNTIQQSMFLDVERALATQRRRLLQTDCSGEFTKCGGVCTTTTKCLADCESTKTSCLKRAFRRASKQKCEDDATSCSKVCTPTFATFDEVKCNQACKAGKAACDQKNSATNGGSGGATTSTVTDPATSTAPTDSSTTTGDDKSTGTTDSSGDAGVDGAGGDAGVSDGDGGESSQAATASSGGVPVWRSKFPAPSGHRRELEHIADWPKLLHQLEEEYRVYQQDDRRTIVYSGDGDSISRVGTYRAYEGCEQFQTLGELYRSNCSSVASCHQYNAWNAYEVIDGSSPGTTFTPFQHEMEQPPSQLSIWVSNAKRVLPLRYREKVTYEGIELNRYTLHRDAFSVNPDNSESRTTSSNVLWSARYNSATSPAGYMNIRSAQQSNMAALLSQPHGMDGSSQIRDQTIGQRGNFTISDRLRYSTFVDVEPITGRTMHARQRLQLTLQLQSDELGERYPNLFTAIDASQPIDASDGAIVASGQDDANSGGVVSKKLHIPVFWVDEAAEITSDGAATFRDQVYGAQELGKGLEAFLIIFGAVMLPAGILFFAFAWKMEGEHF